MNIHEVRTGQGNLGEHPAVVTDLASKAGIQEIVGSTYGDIYGISGVRLPDFLLALKNGGKKLDREVFTSVRDLETTSLLGRGDNTPTYIITDGNLVVDPPEQPGIPERYLRNRKITFSQAFYVAWAGTTDEGEYTYHMQTSKSAAEVGTEIRYWRISPSSLSFKYTRWR